jgi:hypothetical protein
VDNGGIGGVDLWTPDEIVGPFKGDPGTEAW